MTQNAELREALDADAAYQEWLRVLGAQLGGGAWRGSPVELRAFREGWSRCLLALIQSGQIVLKVP